MTTAVTTVLASCQRLLLGRPSFAYAGQPAQAVTSHPCQTPTATARVSQ